MQLTWLAHIHQLCEEGAAPLDVVPLLGKYINVSLTPDSKGRGKRVLSVSNGQRPYICNPPGCIAQIEFYPQYSVTHFWALNESRNQSPLSRPIDTHPLVSEWRIVF